jgi:ribonucleoside-diphosphate reductase alpha chain
MTSNTLESNFYVFNKKGQYVELDFNKVLYRLNKLKNKEPKLTVNVPIIAQHTIKMMVSGISTRKLDDISSKFCASNITNNTDYDKMAVRIEVDNLHRDTKSCYLETTNILNNYLSPNSEEKIEMIHPKLIKFVERNYEYINQVINYDNDYKYCYFGLKTLMKSYLLKHNNVIKERPQQMLMRVSIGIHLTEVHDGGNCSIKTLESIKETYQMMSNKQYTHATPTLFNAGTHRQSLSSCFLLSVDDSLVDIYKTLTDTAMISKWSGGVGIHVSQVRAHKSLIRSTNGESEGIVPMLKMYNDSAVYVSQGGGKRKGSTAVYLETWHADIEDFLDLKKPIGDEMRRARDLFLALWICDLFMERLILAVTTGETVMWSLFCPDKARGLTDVYGDEYKELYLKYENAKMYEKQVSIKELWTHILEIQMEAGVPYISFKDHVNRKNNQNNLGTIKSSNLCVHGNTLILTKEGYYPIKDLANKDVEVWNGSEFSLSPVRKTNVNQELLKITTSDGCELKCTPYHKFYVLNSGNRKENFQYIIKDAYELKFNDKLIKCEFPILKGNKDFDFNYPYTHGFFCGDGTYHTNKNGKKYPWIDLCSDKRNLLEYIEYRDNILISEKDKKIRLKLHMDIKSKYDVPINATLNNKLQWLGGYLDADGCLLKNNALELGSINKKFIMDIKLLCNTLGFNPKLHKNLSDRVETIQKTLCNCKAYYKLYINKNDTYHLYKNLNLVTKRLNYKGNKPENRTSTFVRISSIEQVDDLHDTYCFNEPKEHKGIFNGIISGNCNEINIYTDKNNIGVCNLSSLCLSKFVKKDELSNYSYDYNKLHDVAKKAVENLNRVIDNNVYPVKEGKKSDEENRPIGLGVQSLAKVFFKLKLPFVCEESKEINKKIFETIYHAALEKSCELAKEHGPYKNYHNSMISKGKLQMDLWNVEPSDLWDWDVLRNNIKEFGVRNSLLMALMPTASTAQIMGNTESFEPITSNIFVRNTLSGSFQIVNKHLIKDLEKLNMWNDNMKQQIIARDGSIQTIPSIPDSLKKIYLTIWEISQKDLIDMEADRNAYICQSTSSNRYLKDPDNAKLTSMHVYSWKKGLKTGMYYLRSQAAASAVKFNVDTNILNDANKEGDGVEVDDEECLMCSA